MSRSFSRIFVGYGIITALFIVMHYASLAYQLVFYHPWNDIIILVVSGQYIVTTYLIHTRSKDNTGIFPILVVVSFIFRLLVAVLIMLTLWLLSINDLEVLMINFVCSYLVFLAFELYGLLTNLRPNSDRGQNS